MISGWLIYKPHLGKLDWLFYINTFLDRNSRVSFDGYLPLKKDNVDPIAIK